jgi:hypothetical protein
MCCDGTIFADVKLCAADKSRIAVRRRLPESLRLEPLASCLKQPCPAWIDASCAIYRQRPGHCRHFDCALLQKVVLGETDPGRALDIIRSCCRKAEKVRGLLRRLGDRNERAAVMARFRRTLRRCESNAANQSDGERALLAQLTVAAHNLNRALARHIYP